MGRIATIGLAAAMALFAVCAFGQDRYPSRPVNVISPYPPSGQVDVLLRGLMNPMERFLKQQVVVTYRVGSSAATGIASVASAPADGYTLVIAAPAIATIPEVDKMAGREPSFSADQFAGIARLTNVPTLLVVQPSLPVKNAREFIELARTHPGEVVVSSGGLYGGTHLPMAMLESAENLRFRYLMAEGGGPAMSAVLTGHAVAYAAALSLAAPHIKAGRVRALAHWGDKRLAEFPDLPSFKELGIDVEFSGWTAIFAPAKTPVATLRTLQDALTQAVQDPTFKADMKKANQQIDYLDSTDFHLWYSREEKRLTETVRAIGKQ